MTASQLFAQYIPTGDHRCYYCGGACGDDYPAKTYVKATFTNRDIVARPSSPYVCHGCMESLRSDYPLITMLDGSTRGPKGTDPEKAKPQRIRMYSWVITSDGPVAATKAHITELRELILDPPKPPFAIILSDSGQKNLIFRAPVAHARDGYPVMLEEEVIDVHTGLLAERIQLVTQVVAVVGKPGALEPASVGKAIQFDNHYGDLEVFDAWEAVKSQPISRLAAWLAPNKESAQNEYPSIERRTVSATSGRPGRRAEKAPEDGAGGGEGNGGQVCFDFGEPV